MADAWTNAWILSEPFVCVGMGALGLRNGGPLQSIPSLAAGAVPFPVSPSPCEFDNRLPFVIYERLVEELLAGTRGHPPSQRALSKQLVPIADPFDSLSTYYWASETPRPNPVPSPDVGRERRLRSTTSPQFSTGQGDANPRFCRGLHPCCSGKSAVGRGDTERAP